MMHSNNRNYPLFLTQDRQRCSCYGSVIAQQLSFWDKPTGDVRDRLRREPVDRAKLRQPTHRRTAPELVGWNQLCALKKRSNPQGNNLGLRPRRGRINWAPAYPTNVCPRVCRSRSLDVALRFASGQAELTQHSGHHDTRCGT